MAREGLSGNIDHTECARAKLSGKPRVGIVTMTGMQLSGKVYDLS